MENIVILHTNDLHSHFENWPKMRRFLNEYKQLQAAETTILTVDLGDFADRWHPLTEASNGQTNVALMNQVAYDAATIGNNEGVGNSKYDLNHLYDDADFDVLLANLYDCDTGERPTWAQPYKILETAQGSKIGLLALTAPFPLTYSPNGWDIKFADEILPELLAEMKPQCDILVLMSHLGVSEDLAIAQKYPEIDVIMGSHTHHLFKHGQLVDTTLVAAAGKFGQYIGVVELLVDQHQIVSKNARVVETAGLTALPEDEVEVLGYFEEGHRLLKAEKVAYIPYDLDTDLREPHRLIDVTLQAVKMRAQTDVAILNSGLFLTSIGQGLVNQDELHQTLPHPMHLIRVTLKGCDVIRLVGEIEKNRGFLRNFPIQGMGFRGKIFGQIFYDGLSYDQKTKEVLWQGQTVDLDTEYTLATIDHFMFVPFFPTIELAGRYEFLFPEFIRSVLGEYLETHYPIA